MEKLMGKSNKLSSFPIKIGAGIGSIKVRRNRFVRFFYQQDVPSEQ